MLFLMVTIIIAQKNKNASKMCEKINISIVIILIAVSNINKHMFTYTNNCGIIIL